MGSWWRGAIAVLVFAATLRAEEVWRVDNIAKIGGHAVEVIGAPTVAEVGGARAVLFDGAKDGLFVPAIPFAGAKAFTVEILFYPAEGGPTEQRFLHVQDSNPWRALLETRLDGKGGWWLDTFIMTATPADSGLALIDPKFVHATNKWYWAALRYDGKTMTSFVNGQKELEGAKEFKPFAQGTISLGVRQNKVFWFKGAIREVRFHTEAVGEAKLQRVK